MSQYIEYGIKDRVVIITGAGTGIGEASAIEFAKCGAKVALFGRRMEPLEKVKEQCLEYTENVMALSVDVSDKDAVMQNVEKVVNEFGKIGILVNNAGIEYKIEIGQSRFDDFFDAQEPDDYMEFFKTNTLSHYLMNLAVIPSMKENQFGRIVNISSVLGLDGSYSVPAYTASKAGSITQTKAFARKYGSDNITVNAILPGMVNTPMKLDSSPEEFDIVANLTPLGRVAEPIDIARVVLFLAQENLFVSGQAIVVSGGCNIF